MQRLGLRLNVSWHYEQVKKGFTLLELLIVLVVLAALAALIIPTLGFVKDQADAATTAHGAQEALNNLEIYKASVGHYPNRMDTLVNTSGAYFTKVYGTSSDAFPYGTVGPGNFAYYYLVNGGGITQVANHNEAATDPNNSSVAAALDSTTNFCIIDPLNAQPFYESAARKIVLACYPNQSDPANPVIPANHQLIAMGIGSLNSAVGATMTTAPLCPEKSAIDPAEYDRYIAVFDVSPGGGTGRGSVKLKVVLDSQYKLAATNLEYYKASKPTDDAGTPPPPPTP